MDKNNITGIILITAILGVFWWINKPSEAELERQRHYQDSMAIVSKAKEEAKAELGKAQELAKKVEAELDSAQLVEMYGLFAGAAKGTQEFITLENSKMKMVLSTKGGYIHSVELKDYQTHDSLPLMVAEANKNQFGFHFTHNQRNFYTNDLYFQASNVTDSTVTLSIQAAEGKMDFVYKLPADSYMADFNILTSRMSTIISGNSLDLDWKMDVMAKEKGIDFERRYSGVYFKYFQDEVDNIHAAGSNSDVLKTKVEWVAFRDQFFSSVLIAKDLFIGGEVAASSPKEDKDINPLIMNASAKMSVAYTGDDNIAFNYYFGPNDFKALKPYADLGLRQLVELGWGFLRWINLGVIEVFNFLEKYISSYGLIILILTVLIKLILFPLTYKSYISTAKMKVLKPQIEEINNKIPKEKTMERQQATMALYRKAGVNPMGGCLPMVLQMPILFAMFQFFPASIELRQQSFLWATDLSSYDAIFTWDVNIPLISNFYGNHVSLFCLLMSITNLVYTRINQEMTQSSQQMPGMKGMMYMMPVMFLFFFNNYASGLSYYYFISTLITIGQTIIIRRFVDEDALLAQLKANQKKPMKKSGFQKRLEDVQKQQRLKAQGGKTNK